MIQSLDTNSRISATERMMTSYDIPDDFVALTGRQVVSPSLKITARLGRWDMAMAGTQHVNIHFDPKIDANHLWMLESESPLYVPDDTESQKDTKVPFFSSDRADVTQFAFDCRVEGDTLVFISDLDDRSARIKIEVMKRLPVDAVKDNPTAALRLILRAIGRLRDWPDTVPGIISGRKFEIRINSKFAEAIDWEFDQSISERVSGECLIAHWEVAK